MEEENNRTLSKKIIVGDCYQGTFIYIDDVKDFIKRVKDRIDDEVWYDEDDWKYYVFEIIDQEAGKELAGDKEE